MRRLTFGQVLSSRFASAIGLCATMVDECAAVLNECQERLVKDPNAPDEGFWGGWAKVAFDVSRVNPYITLPRDIARFILLDVCKHPTRLQNGFYEFLEFGVGQQPSSCRPNCGQQLQAYDRETVVTFTDFIKGTTIRAYITNAADEQKRALISGTDTTNERIVSQDGLNQVQGEFISFATPFVDMSMPMNSLTGILKDITYGPVQFFSVDSNGIETLLLTMEPGEQSAMYRRYFINGLPCNCCESETGKVQVVAQCKLDFVPVRVPTDYCIIQCLPALIEEAQSLRYSSIDNPNAASLAEVHHQRALKMLFGELDHFIGKEQPAVNVSLFGSQPLRPSLV